MQSDKTIQLGALRIFEAVAESDTLTHAADRLGISQSAVSQAISQLEQTTECALVIRRSKPIKLTPAGVVMRAHAAEILASTRRMLTAVQQVSDSGLPHLAVGLIDSFGDVAVEQLVVELEKMAVQLSLQTGFTGSLTQAFLQHDLDLLLTTDPVDEHQELERHAIMRDPFVLAVSKDDFERYSVDENDTPAVDLKALAAHQHLIRYTKETRIGKMTNLVARRLDIQQVAKYEFDSTSTLLNFVSSSRGWAITTGMCIARHRDMLDNVKLVPVANSANARYLSLLARKGELGDIPVRVAAVCRLLCDQEIMPRIIAMAPWLKGQVHSISELPPI